LIYINIVLAIFNLVPVFPLDGEKILSGLLPRNLSFEFQAVMQKYGTLILIFLVLPVFGSSPIISLISPIINFIFSLLV
ncbi:site-2 protease family protein, partial [Patescibacteria group bacterium]|nr:site-2 protease family protein [Patescibacteria group bacterium]MBU1457442.1 site-2 protease family protein [Patescibacteria group bacterium]